MLDEKLNPFSVPVTSQNYISKRRGLPVTVLTNVEFPMDRQNMMGKAYLVAESSSNSHASSLATATYYSNYRTDYNSD